jgi:hypothetical protein
MYDHQESEVRRLGCTSPPPHHVPYNYERKGDFHAYCERAYGDPHGLSDEVGGHFVIGV